MAAIDFSKFVDTCLPPKMSGERGAYQGKLQQTVHGNLITNTYQVVVEGGIDTCCLCCKPNPKVFTNLDVVAPNYELTNFVMPMDMGVPMPQVDPNYQPQVEHSQAPLQDQGIPKPVPYGETKTG